jgi:PEP-CTERM motif
MRVFQRTKAAGLAAVMAFVGFGAAKAADAIPYPCCGYNSATYSFTAAATGDLVAYFAGSTASYDNELGVLVNGVQQGGFGLDDHSSAVGQSIDFGHVTAGETLVFILHNLTLGADAFSDPSMNVGYDNGPATGTTDGHNHVYSTAYTGTSPILDSIPAGTFVAFEDLRFPDSDYNYNDETFVFTDVSAVVRSGTPEPATWAMMLAGVAAIGAGLRMQRREALSLV